jgi:hypothetical protein
MGGSGVCLLAALQELDVAVLFFFFGIGGLAEWGARAIWWENKINRSPVAKAGGSRSAGRAKPGRTDLDCLSRLALVKGESGACLGGFVSAGLNCATRA